MPGRRPTCPTQVQGDPGRLRQILTNLVGNAIKFTEHGEVAVRVTTEANRMAASRSASRSRIPASVWPPESRERVFESFQQADGSTTRQYGGTGLGLAISKQLAELMGGAIGVDSELGRGSRFWFTAVVERVASARPRTGPSRRGRHVLVVDDSSANRAVVLHHLHSWGFACDEADCAEAAWPLIVEQSRDRAGPSTSSSWTTTCPAPAA